MDVIPIDDGVARANAVRGTRPDGGPQSCSTCGCYPDQTAAGVIDHLTARGVMDPKLPLRRIRP